MTALLTLVFNLTIMVTTAVMCKDMVIWEIYVRVAKGLCVTHDQAKN